MRNNKYPRISIIIPAYNEETKIEQNLRAIFAQDYPVEKVEILVVDGQSSDRTRDIVQGLQASHPGLRLLNNPARFTPQAINTGLRHATGDIIILMSGHAIMHVHYLANSVRVLQTHAVDAVGGWVETVGDTYQAKAIALAMSSQFGVGGVAFRTARHQIQHVDTVVFGAYTRDIIERVGFFDEELVRNQDDEYNYRLRKLGGQLMFSLDIQSRYYSRGTIGKLFRQYFQYGYYKVRVMQKHPHQMRPRQFVPVTFVVSLLGLSVVALRFRQARKLLALEVVSYAAANIGASLKIAFAKGLEYIPVLPAIFAAIHVSYGLGFLLGLIKFWDRWGTD